MRQRSPLPRVCAVFAASAVLACAASSASRHSPQDATLPCADRLELGKQLEQRGADADALETYEPCIETFPEAIALLARRYAPAREFLLHRKETLSKSAGESMSRGENPPTSDLTLLVALNWGLELRTDNVALFDRALAMPTLTNTAQTLHGFVWPDLVSLGRYQDVLRWEAEVRASVDGLRLMARVSKGDQSHEQSIRHAQEEAALYARALSGAGRAQDARATFSSALELDRAPTTYADFILGVSAAGDLETAKWIRDRASETLGQNEMRTVDEVIERARRPND